MEHIAAVLHPKFGAPTRGRVGGVSILPSVKKRAAMGATLDIPVHHIKAMLVRSHFDAIEIRVPDAPGADELLLALAVTQRRQAARARRRPGGRPDVVGEDGLAADRAESDAHADHRHRPDRLGRRRGPAAPTPTRSLIDDGRIEAVGRSTRAATPTSVIDAHGTTAHSRA